MAQGKPTLLHLNNSQSQVILWLLEELGIEYNLKLFERQKDMRAPPGLKESHPLGKSPQLVTAEGRVIAERIAIAKYLIDNFDNSGIFKLDPSDNVHDIFYEEEILSFGGNSLSFTLMMKMMLRFMASVSPFFVKPVIWGFGAMLNKGFLDETANSQLRYLDDQLANKDYFMKTAGPTRTDFCMLWYADLALMCGISLLTYPNIHAWYMRCKDRDAWKRALEKGNGYDMGDFQKL